jgi:hypothetical protein
MVGVLNNHWIPTCAGMMCLGLTQPTGVFQQAANHAAAEELSQITSQRNPPPEGRAVENEAK